MTRDTCISSCTTYGARTPPTSRDAPHRSSLVLRVASRLHLLSNPAGNDWAATSKTIGLIIRQVLRVFGSEEIDMAEHAVYLIPTSSSIINPHAVVIPARFPR